VSDTEVPVFGNPPPTGLRDQLYVVDPVTLPVHEPFSVAVPPELGTELVDDDNTVQPVGGSMIGGSVVVTTVTVREIG
jgi:hypothetical protein